MSTRRRSSAVLAAVLTVLLVAGVVTVLRTTVLKPTRITALFTTATAIYPGDQVRVAGVRVGTIEDIEPQAPRRG